MNAFEPDRTARGGADARLALGRLWPQLSAGQFFSMMRAPLRR